MKETKNATIRSTYLGKEPHGLMSYLIQLDYEDSFTQAFGGYSLNSYGIDAIEKILNVVEVDNWEKLKGKNIRIAIVNNNIVGIGHITKNIWYYPEKKYEKQS